LAAPSFALFAKGGNAELLVEEEEELVDLEDDFRTFLLVRNSYPTAFQHFTLEPWLFAGSMSEIAIFRQLPEPHVSCTLLETNIGKEKHFDCPVFSVNFVLLLRIAVYAH
jgi:hypothetical protein